MAQLEVVHGQILELLPFTTQRGRHETLVQLKSPVRLSRLLAASPLARAGKSAIVNSTLLIRGHFLLASGHHSIYNMTKYSILFVCTDNLCRSPTADGVMRQQVIDHGLETQVKVDSAGTHDFNVAEPVDIRTQKHAMRRDYDLSGLRARLLQAEDFESFDLILAMDEGNMLTLRMRCPEKYHDKLHYFTEFCSSQVSRDVPDPFYGKAQDFEHVLDLIEDGCEGIMRQVERAIS
jgi:protein-tyrosine phosphatase